MAAKMRAEASDSPVVKQQYANGMWAMPFRAVELETTEDLILQHRDPDLEPLKVPGDAVALTAGIDVQKRGFWYVVKAWRPDLSSAVIDYGRLTDWDSVHALMETRYDYEDNSPNAGKSLAIWRAGIDSGVMKTWCPVPRKFTRLCAGTVLGACLPARGRPMSRTRRYAPPASTGCPAPASASRAAYGCTCWIRTISNLLSLPGWNRMRVSL